MIFSKPTKQADKTRIHLQNICTDSSILLVKLKSSTLALICKHAAGMMLPLSFAVIQNNHWMLRGRRILIGCKSCIRALGIIFLIRCFTKVKYWHNSFSCFYIFCTTIIPYFDRDVHFIFHLHRFNVLSNYILSIFFNTKQRQSSRRRLL